MITTLDIIDRLPFELASRLEGDDFFSDIPVVVAEEGNVALMMAQKQAVITAKGGHRGVAVIVLQVVADDDFPNLQFGPVTLYPAFQVVENLELNRDANGTGKSARKIARRVRDVIKCAGFVGFVKNMQADKPTIAPVPLAKELGDLVKSYVINFKCLEVGTEAISQVQMPQFVSLAPAAQFGIECATPAAEIWYTLDDSPVVRNGGTAVCYTDPVDVPESGVTVRACAWADGMIASWVNRAVIKREELKS